MGSDEELEEDDEIIDIEDNKYRVVENEEEEEEEDDANSENQAKVAVREETPSKTKVFARNFCQKTYTSKQDLDSHKVGSHLGGIVCPAVGCELRYTSIKEKCH